MSDAPPPVPQHDRTWLVLAHLSSFVGLALGLWSFLGPLTVWLIRRDLDREAEYHAREALNFQLSLLFWSVIAIVMILTVILFPLGVLLLIAVGLASIVLTIIAAVKASNGDRYRYPFTWRLVGPPASERAAAPPSAPEREPGPAAPPRASRRADRGDGADSFDPYDPERDDYQRDERAR